MGADDQVTVSIPGMKQNSRIPDVTFVSPKIIIDGVRRSASVRDMVELTMDFDTRPSSHLLVLCLFLSYPPSLSSLSSSFPSLPSVSPYPLFLPVLPQTSRAGILSLPSFPPSFNRHEEVLYPSFRLQSYCSCRLSDKHTHSPSNNRCRCPFRLEGGRELSRR